MRVAAYQAPYLPFGSWDAVDLMASQLIACESAGVELLCCPEAIIGGLAHESAGQSPRDVALTGALGCSRIVDPDGRVLAQAHPDETALVVADVEPRRRPHDPRGWDGHLNPDVSGEYAALLGPP